MITAKQLHSNIAASIPGFKSAKLGSPDKAPLQQAATSPVPSEADKHSHVSRIVPANGAAWAPSQSQMARDAGGYGQASSPSQGDRAGRGTSRNGGGTKRPPNDNAEDPNQDGFDDGSGSGGNGKRGGWYRGKDGTPVSRGKRPFSREDDDEDTLVTDSKRAKVSSPNGEAFACPYWKKDAQTYSSCYKFKFEHVRQVKQHLARRHVKKIRCPRCQGKFETGISCDDHIRDSDCVRQPRIMDEGIDQDQMVKLGKKGQASQSQFQRWYVLWRIVFPGIVEPVSPYNDDDGLSEFLQQEGPAIILGHMRQLPNWNQDDEDRFSQVPSRIILDIKRQWVAQRAQGNGQTVAGGTADLPDEEPLTDLALDLSPSLPNAQGVHGTTDGLGDGNYLDLPLFPDNVALPGVSGEISMLDEHYFSTEDPWMWTA
jgi:hypothetical protein